MKSKITPRFILLFLFIICIIGSCKKDDQTRLQADWITKDPIAIPSNVRSNERGLGNLAANPSFETGKIYYEERNVESYDINGWKKVGQHIKWINSDNAEYTEDEVYHGSHSIKIERNTADETESTGEGIISDFIKVIPGNYSLKLHLKLKNICPNQSRIGTKMYDAINIRLQYFDKNRLPISGIEHDAFTNKNIDNTFKAFTLSNYWHINEFGWGEIHGKTANYPFFDGDIPDDARYVKIFIGLKGTGQMWIDDIDFRYTEENFTMLERLKPYFDSSYLAYDMVYPKPKSIEKNKEIKFCNVSSDLYPLIVVPDNAVKEVQRVAMLLKNYLIEQIKATNDSINPDICIISKLDSTQINKSQLVFSIGQNSIYDQFKPVLPDSILIVKDDAYYICQNPNTNIIFINGSSDDAFKYALNTITQLFDAKSSIYHSANIMDYPDFLERAYLVHFYDGTLDELNQKLKLFDQYKFNSSYFEWYTSIENNYPFNHFDQVNSSSNSLMIDLLKLSSFDGLITDKLLKNVEKDIFSEPLKSVLLVGNYYQEHEDCNSDKVNFYSNKNFNKHLQFDHIELLNAFNKYISGKNLATNLEFLSPWNSLDIIDNGYGKAEFYYYDLQKEWPTNLSLFWTGGNYFTSSVDCAEFFRMSKLTGMSPILLDNSLLKNDSRLKTDYEKDYYAGKIRVQSLLEPYELNTFDDFYLKSGKNKILLNIKDLSELNTIRILTAADYFWNTKSYNPDKSVWIVLNKLLGRENAINLIYFNDAYFGLKEICQKIELNGQQFKNIRIAKNFETQLNKYFNLLENSLNNKDLLKELELLKSALILKYSELTSSDK